MFGIDDAVNAALSLGGKLIDRLIPDPTEAAKAKIELFKMQQTGELAQLDAVTKLAVGQLEVNKVEAGNASVFVSGWRPAVGWVCVVALFSQFLVRPLFEFGAKLAGYVVTFPPLDTGDLMTLLLGMLGLGALRSAEKFKGVASK